MHTMGNCVAFQLSPRKQTRGSLIEEAETESESKASAVVLQHINNANGPYKRYIVVRRKLQNEEINHLASLLTPSVKLNPKVHCTTTERRRVKIVVTLEQLELLLRGEKKKIQIKNGIVCFKQSFGLQRCHKWQPSLPTIAEVHNC